MMLILTGEKNNDWSVVVSHQGLAGAVSCWSSIKHTLLHCHQLHNGTLPAQVWRYSAPLVSEKQVIIIFERDLM